MSALNLPAGLKMPPTPSAEAAKQPFVAPEEYSHLPAEFLSGDDFCVFRLEPSENGRTNKIPYHPEGFKCNDPKRGVSFESAYAAKVAGKFDGVGRYVKPPITVVDIDKCVDPTTRTISDEALEIVSKLNSFAELSVSGTGIHVWLQGTKPGPACRKGNVEIYSQDRFMALGSRIEGVPTTIEERTEELREIYNKFLSDDSTKPEKTSETVAQKTSASVQIEFGGTAHTTKYELLMRGTLSGDKPCTITDNFNNSITYPGRSEADLALCNESALKHGNNPDAIWEDYAVSAVFQPEWGKREADFRRFTIAKAIAWSESVKSVEAAPTKVAPQSAAQAKPFVMVQGDQFMREKIAPRKVLMRTKSKGEAIFFAKSINQVFAWRGLGKTCLGLGLAAAFATGGSILNFEALEPANVLYIEGELPEEQMQERWKQIIGETQGRARLVTIDKQPEHAFPSFATDEGMARVEATLAQCAVEGFPVEILFLDSVSTLFNIVANDEENWIRIQTWLISLRSRGICIFFFHHAGKSGMSRSHSKSEDMLDVSIKLDKPKDSEEGILHAVLEFDKCRHAICEPRMEIKMRTVHSDKCACKLSKSPLIGCRGDSVAWERRIYGNVLREQAEKMFSLGASPEKVAKDLSVAKGTVKTWRTEYGHKIFDEVDSSETKDTENG